MNKRDFFIVLFFIFILSLNFSRALNSSELSFEKIHFTNDGSSSGTPLIPGFTWGSCWWALGNDNSGKIYVAISNHLTSGNGNVVIVKYDPVLNKMIFLNDIRNVSLSYNNWLNGENQQKVHTQITQHNDGKLYFATHDNSYGTLTEHRGTHIYYIENDSIVDFSNFSTQYLDRNMITQNGSIGVSVQNYGTISMQLTDGTPNLFYGVTYGDGYFYVLDLDTGNIKMIAKTGKGYAEGIIRHFAVDKEGNAFVPMRGNATVEVQIYKYNYSSDNFVYTGKNYNDFGLTSNTDKSGWRMQVYTKNKEMVYLLSYDGKLYRFTFASENLEYLGTLESNPIPEIADIVLSDDENHIYSLIYRYGSSQNLRFVDFDIAHGNVSTLASSITTFGNRDLIYGGLAKDNLGNAYMVGWQFGGSTNVDNIALFKVKVESKMDGVCSTFTNTCLNNLSAVNIYQNLTHNLWTCPGKYGGQNASCSSLIISSIYHPADYDAPYNILSSNEIMNYIERYFSSSGVTLSESLYALTLLQSGGEYYYNSSAENCKDNPWTCYVMN